MLVTISEFSAEEDDKNISGGSGDEMGTVDRSDFQNNIPQTSTKYYFNKSRFRWSSDEVVLFSVNII